LVKGDIALLSYSPGGSTPREVARGRCNCDTNLGLVDVEGGQRWYHYKTELTSHKSADNWQHGWW